MPELQDMVITNDKKEVTAEVVNDVKEIVCNAEASDFVFVTITFEGKDPKNISIFADSGASDFFFKNHEDTPSCYYNTSNNVSWHVLKTQYEHQLKIFNFLGLYGILVSSLTHNIIRKSSKS